MTVIIRGGSNGIQVQSDRSEAKIRDLRTAGGIDEDIWLDGSQWGI